MNTKYLKIKDTSEVIPIAWTFQDPSIIVTSASCVATVELGIDASPSTILYNNPILQGNNQVIQVVQGGLDGVTYKIVLTANLADGTVFNYTVYLPVQAP